MKKSVNAVVPEFASGATEEQVDTFQRTKNANGYYGGEKFDLKGGKPRQQNRSLGEGYPVTIGNGMFSGTFLVTTNENPEPMPVPVNDYITINSRVKWIKVSKNGEPMNPRIDYYKGDSSVDTDGLWGEEEEMYLKLPEDVGCDSVSLYDSQR